MNLGDSGGGIGSMGGASDFVRSALAAIGGGSRTSQTTSSVNNSNIQFNPTIVQSAGGSSPTVSPYAGGISANPAASATSSAAGQDPSSLLSRNLPTYRTTPTGNALYDPLNTLGGGQASAGGDLMLPLLLGAGVLFLVMQD
jgi:hypothetical protein